MALKTFKPTTPGQRQLVIIDRSELWKGPPVKALTEGKREQGGRNNNGRITVRWRGGGHKRRFRIIDFKRTKRDMPAEVVRLEYDPNRSGFIALVKYEDGELAYILAPQRLKAGDKVVAGERVDVKPGNAMPMRNIPVGTIIHNVEMKPGKGGQLARSAGTYVQLVGRDAGYALLRLASGEVRPSPPPCGWSIGFIATPRTEGRQPSQRLRPALPMLMFCLSGFDTAPIVAMHSARTMRTSPEERRSSA